MGFKTSIKFAGVGGEGVITAGELTVNAIVDLGLEASMYKSFAADMKGGQAISLITISDSKIISPLSDFDILFAYNENAFRKHKHFLRDKNILIMDLDDQSKGEIIDELEELRKTSGVEIYKIPISKIAKEKSGSFLSKNIVSLGVVSGLLNIPIELYERQIVDRYKKKGPAVTESNLRALNAGFAWTKEGLGKKKPFLTFNVKDIVQKKEMKLIEGNEAIALGALAAGCRFYASYPITPATSIGEYLSEGILSHDGYAYQAEDEIAALGSVIGASFSGVKSMTATSGPGLSLMQEMLGLASMAEIPVVIVDVQRGGPSTGMPTKHEQGDLMAAIFGGHGEGQRIVLAARNVEDNFYLTIEAFNMSEKYQCPVILLSDSSLSMVKEVMEYPSFTDIKVVNRKVLKGLKSTNIKDFNRYNITDDGISPMLIPGISQVTYTATGVEHDEDSSPIHPPEIRSKLVQKRFKKLEKVVMDNSHPIEWDLDVLDGKKKTDISIVSWGLSASITKEAVRKLRERGYRVSAMYPKLLYPLPVDSIKEICSKSDTVLVVEANYSGQLAQLIQMHVNVKLERYNISIGEPFFPEEIVKKVETILNKEEK